MSPALRKERPADLRLRQNCRNRPDGLSRPHHAGAAGPPQTPAGLSRDLLDPRVGGAASRPRTTAPSRWHTSPQSRPGLVGVPRAGCPVGGSGSSASSSISAPVDEDGSRRRNTRTGDTARQQAQTASADLPKGRSESRPLPGNGDDGKLSDDVLAVCVRVGVVPTLVFCHQVGRVAPVSLPLLNVALPLLPLFVFLGNVTLMLPFAQPEGHSAGRGKNSLGKHLSKLLPSPGRTTPRPRPLSQTQPLQKHSVALAPP
jgi:hypothetical protein